MNFKALNIHTYGGPPKGTIKFGGERGDIDLVLDEQFTREVLAVCAAALVRVSKAAAEEMAAEVIEAVMPRLEDKEGDDGTEAT